MTYFESFILGLVQGLGEFLPISSSAHLVVLPWLANFKDPGLSFDVALHLGTLFAVVGYFGSDWYQLGKKSFQFCLLKKSEYKNDFLLLLKLALASVPAALAGVFLDDWAETSLRTPWFVALNMIFLGAVLLWIDRKKAGETTVKNISLTVALLIGCSQALALFPGVSRSGITITAALILGLTRVEAARFSFLLSMPIIFGACLFKYKYVAECFTDAKALLGILTAAVFGFLSIKYLLKLVQTRSYSIFCYYRFIFGAVIFLAYLLKGISS